MEKIFLNQDNIEYWQEKEKPSVVALGFFDGIHKGHREVIKTAAKISKRKSLSLAVMSFFPHPKTVISNCKIHYLMPLAEKEKELRKLGVDTFYIVEFNKEFASLQPVQFVAQYLINLGVVHAVAGFDYTYGYKGTGNMDRLKNDSGGLIDVTKVEKLELQGEKISSTCIREKLLKGKVDELPSLLGHPYKVECEWNGNTLKHKPYYTLPAPGCYEVTLKNKIGSFKTKVTVLEIGEGHALKCMTEIPKYMAGSLSIVWYRRLKEKHIFGWSGFLAEMFERKQVLNHGNSTQ
ncbi:FAD synthetase family protein [Bacillus sp. EB600]|uniref:FAD synthetase family protein n=1 Tax=Bacillus sp. EB600 TaxID=2806345 RepID=UPI002108D919|nr:FAD synthetase family protein [Bacillus sp. EB600]MCQ6282283.1 FAD synthetase family protein [Bacillus sp. EB600]